ncbi:nucleoside deaminase [Gudongella sp. DL1XJH-153]|uniref:nucleoside deaminase n=1 Tax=Gudongella sp. DL1XJH-153 TaxID=3409804 RepID=UPI003BB74260
MNKYMKAAINEALLGIEKRHGGPFGAVVVKDGIIIGRGHNNVIGTKDPSAHGEIVAIREATRALDDFDLSGCELYTTCEPCPMCYGAIHWARIDKVYYGATKEDAAKVGFDDQILNDILPRQEHHGKPQLIQIYRDECMEVFKKYEEDEEKQLY